MGLLEVLLGDKVKNVCQNSSPASPSSPGSGDAGDAFVEKVFNTTPSTMWPPESLDAERRFGQPHAKLFPFIGRKVRTPAGHGTLLQVFAERVTVLLDSDLDKCAVFAPVDIEPVSWS